MLEANERQVLINVSQGRPFEAGCTDHQAAARAMFSCIAKGWINGGRITIAGQIALAGSNSTSSQTPKGDFCIVQEKNPAACNRGTVGCVATSHLR